MRLSGPSERGCGGGLILGIETSCDDTCAAVVDGSGAVRANVISSQAVHGRFGGVVPEIASRHHLELIDVVVAQALADAGAELSDVGLVAVTQGPGLIGALLVGLASAKALAAARELPLAAVDHLQGHVAANFLASDRANGGDGAGTAAGSGGAMAGDGDEAMAGGAFAPPFLCLIASGGHTLLAAVRDHEGFEVLGSTLDDAAGEAFDKGARMLGLGYPGGAALERLATGGDPQAFELPVGGSRRRPGAARAAFAESLDFSFAGVKTALWQRLGQLPERERESRRADLAASYQAAIVDGLLMRVEQALARSGFDRLAVGGGVAANGELRRRLRSLGVTMHVPPPVLCTDNAAMIASAARFQRPAPYPGYLSLDAYAAGELVR